jgi:hypothetical protein
MWDWNALFGRKIRSTPLIEQNLKFLCANDLNDDDLKLQSENLVRKWLLESSDDLDYNRKVDTVREEINSAAANIPCIEKNSMDQKIFKLDQLNSTSKFDVAEDLSRLSRTGTEHERTPAAPDELPKESFEKKISCFSFRRNK